MQQPAYRRGVWAAWLLLTGGVLALVLAPPLLDVPGQVGVRWCFSGVCHQLPDRTFELGGVLLAVCRRCTGIYAGLFLGVLTYPLLRRWDAFLGRHTAWVFGAALLVVGLDWGLHVAGIWTNGPVSQTVTGLVFGWVAGYYLGRTAHVQFTTPPQGSAAASELPGAGTQST